MSTRPDSRDAPPRAVGFRVISFGPVAVPVTLHSAVSEPSGARRWWQPAKRGAVRLPAEELLEADSSRLVDIFEFVPCASVDPIYLERSYYLAPTTGGEKAYRLLAEAMAQADRGAIAKLVLRDMVRLAFIRPAHGGLVLHTMHFLDEVRGFVAVAKGRGARIRQGELALALRLIEELSHEAFKPEEYVAAPAPPAGEEAEAWLRRRLEGLGK